MQADCEALQGNENSVVKNTFKKDGLW